MSKHEKIEIRNKRNWKNKILVIFLVIVSCILIDKYNVIHNIVIAINPITINNLKIETEKSELELGEEINIKTEITPDNYTKSNLVWHSSNEDVVEINDGKAIAKSLGKSKIYLSDDETKSNEIEIECLVKLEDVIIENMIKEMKIGEVYKLKTKIIPENATYNQLEFESTNPNILTIDNEGNLIANAIGKSTINIKNCKNGILKTFEIEVKKIPVDKIELDDREVTLGKGQNYILNAKVTPTEATYTDVVWESSDNNIVTIEDRKIKANNVGTATITAITDNGDKKISCTFKVNNNNPNNTKKYANGNYNIRTGESTDYKILATTNQYEEIEFLKDTKNGWKKVRNSKGIVGYTLVKDKYYLTEKPNDNVSVDNSNVNNNIVTSYHIANVPYINQFSLGYPTGCEAVSATMVLKYKGYNVSVQNIVNNTKCGSKKYQKSDGKWYGANPFEQFVGNPSLGLSKGSYGVFAKPIVSAMSVYAGENVKNISGCTENTLFNYVSKGKPVVVWCVKNAGNLTNGVIWNYEDESGSFQELVGEHCAVLIGYDENYVYLNDPSAGQNVKQSKSKFISNWKKLYSQAIIVE